MFEKEAEEAGNEKINREYCKDREAHEDIRIREDDGKWREPLVEVEE